MVRYNIGYLSKFEGTEVDAAVERVQGIDAEFDLKVDKTLEINGHPLETSFNLTYEDVQALPDTTKYGNSVEWEDNILYLKDQDGTILNSTVVISDAAVWGNISGTLSNQLDLKEALDSKYDTSNPAGYVQDTRTINGYALSSDITLSYTDVGAMPATTTIYDLTSTAQQAALDSGANATNIAQITTNKNDISTINSKIPSAATSSNQLADKDFVNSSIATSTATFIGTFNSLADLEAYSGPLDDNDYAFVITTDAVGNTIYNRYKYTEATTPASWQFEYALNNSSFTADQWAAINSGATTTNIGQITTNKNDISTINTTLGGFGNIVTHNTGEFATAAQGALADTALQSIDSAMVVAALGYTPYDDTNPDGFISGITSSDVVAALGYTPADNTLVLHTTGNETKTGNLGISGSLSATGTFVLGDSTQAHASGEITLKKSANSNLTSDVSIELNDNELKFYADNSSSVTTTPLVIDFNAGTLTGITPQTSDNSTKLATTAYVQNQGYITGITSSDVTTALGYTPYNSTNPDGFISSAAISSLTDVTLSSLSGGQILKYDSTDSKWKNTSVAPTTWGSISGTLANQTDLQTALNGKQDSITGAASSVVSNDLTTSRVVVSDTYGKIAASSINTTKLGYLSDVSSNIQVQINSKQNSDTAVTHVASTAVGSATQPIYVASDGTATATTYSLEKSVPADAVFTDTTYSVFTGADGSVAGTSGLVPAPSAIDNTKVLMGDGTWTELKTVNSNSLLGSGDISFPTVDQTYDPTSANAQSGVAISGAGFITGIDSSDVTTALGYSPANIDLSNLSVTGQQKFDEKQDILMAGTDIEIVKEEAFQLPEGYTQLRYLKTTTTAYIDTGLSPSDIPTQPKIITKFQTEEMGDKDYFGTSSNNQKTIIWDVTPQANYIRWGSTDRLNLVYEAGFGTASLHFSDQPKILEVSGLTDVSIKVNNVLAATSTFASAEMVSTEHITIGRSRAGTEPSGVMWYYFKIYDGDVLKFEGIPAVRNSDSVLGMYDTVSETFLTNAGTGDFISGGELEHETVINFVNRSGYVLKTNFATQWVGGVIRIGNEFLLDNSGVAKAGGKTYSQYTSASNNIFISKETLENVFTGKGFISGITSSDVTTALGYTPYNAANPNGYISSAAISSLTDVTLNNLSDGEVLKYDSANNVWVNDTNGSSTLSGLTDVTITNPSQGQNLVYDAVNNVWINASTSATVGWGGITGTLSDQTDLQDALNSKASVTIRDWSS